MIKIVAIKTAIANRCYTSKTIVNVFQLIYVIITLVIVGSFDKTPQQLFKISVGVVLLMFILRLILAKFPKVCGECHKPLIKNNSIACSGCRNYNVYDLKLWSSLEFDDVDAAHKAEISRIIQNVVALIIVLSIFLAPVMYFFLVIDKDIRQLNQQRQIVFVQTRPLFLRYKAEHGVFPKHLEQLFPNYIDEIPKVLINLEGDSSQVSKINYQVNENTAKFIFNVTNIPNLKASYDIATGEYGYDSKLAQLLL